MKEAELANAELETQAKIELPPHEVNQLGDILYETRTGDIITIFQPKFKHLSYISEGYSNLSADPEDVTANIVVIGEFIKVLCMYTRDNTTSPIDEAYLNEMLLFDIGNIFALMKEGLGFFRPL